VSFDSMNKLRTVTDDKVINIKNAVMKWATSWVVLSNIVHDSFI